MSRNTLTRARRLFVCQHPKCQKRATHAIDGHMADGWTPIVEVCAAHIDWGRDHAYYDHQGEW